MRLQLMTWPQVEAYLASKNAVIIPIGSTEQHGPTGLIGTDALCAEAIAQRVGERLDVVVAPTIDVGMAQHHMAFPGSLTLRPSTLMAVLRDTLLSLSHHGFQRIFVINGHGGNTATIQAAFAETQMELDRMTPRPDLRTKLANWWDSPAVDKLASALYGDATGSHATPPEVAVTWALHPELADQHRLVPPVAPNGPFFGAADFRASFPDGRIGSNPSLATPEAGLQFLETSVDELAGMAGRFFA